MPSCGDKTSHEGYFFACFWGKSAQKYVILGKNRIKSANKC